MPIISIIIPCYNCENYIDRCLTSIVSQDFPLEDFEVICVDDASTDNTWNKLLEWDEKYPSLFKLLKQNENTRQGGARNLAFKYAEGKYITYIDSDDWVEKNYLSILYRGITDYNCEISMVMLAEDTSTSLSYFSEDKLKTDKQNRMLTMDSIEKHGLLYHLQILKNYPCGKLIRKSFLEENNIYFPSNLAYEDHFWGGLLQLYVSDVYIIEENLYHYYVNSQSTINCSGAGHHIDLLTVQIMFLEEVKNRGLYNKHHEEIDFEFLFAGYLALLKLNITKFEEISYSTFLLTRAITLSYVPNYKFNKYYLDNSLSNYHKLLLQTLDNELNRNEFNELIAGIKQIGL